MSKPHLASMPVDALLKLRAEIERTLSSRAAQLRNDLSKLSGRGGGEGGGSPLKGRKVPAKYRSPSGETWAGRGARPRWLVEALKKGKKMENFLIARRRVKRRRSK
jgi:DNA-binding protein H-NS